MTTPTPDRLFETLDATWPAKAFRQVGPWQLRQGDGGGQRVSAATRIGASQSHDIETAETEMRALDQTPLFMIRDRDHDLDELLSARGYDVVDPVNIYLSPVARLTAGQPLTASMPSWPPLAAQRELWQGGGVGPARIAVMDRCKGPKTSLLGRSGDVPAGTAFVGLGDEIAMIHAIEVMPDMRRAGVGRTLVNGAANWAAEAGARWMCLAVTKANAPANALYRALGMTIAASYHYRRAPETPV